MMSADNHTIFDPVTYILTEITGREESRVWIIIPFCLMYVATLFGNSLLLFIIFTERSLHKPMYLFLSMLATADLIILTTTVPNMLAVFWFSGGEISFVACLTQMFLNCVSFTTESAILLAMAFDRYVAICNPLRYTTVLTKSVIGKMGLAAVTRSFCIIFPLIFFMKRLKFCRTNLLPHTYCENMIIARMACDNITVHLGYGLGVATFIIGLDVVLIALSYGLILRAVFRLPCKDAQLKALRTCGSHFCVILMFYVPSFSSFFAYQFGHNIPGYSLDLLSSLHVLIPPMLNPIVYGVTTKEILKQVINVFYPCGSRSSLLS
ncbi:olfactory receptor 52B2-like [Macrochelys suwanniensis]